MSSPVCIVCPVYETPYAYLRELADSIDPAGLGADGQVIWVEDGSKDLGGYRRLQSDFKNDPRHRFLELPRNGGVPAALNAGVRAAPAEALIVTMGSDDIFSPGYLSTARSMLHADANLDVVVPTIELFEAEQGQLDPGPEQFRLKGQIVRNSIPAASMFRKRLWERLGGFDETLVRNFEDWDFWFRARLSGAQFRRLGAVGYRYRVRGNSHSRSLQFYPARRKLWLKWAPLVTRESLKRLFRRP